MNKLLVVVLLCGCVVSFFFTFYFGVKTVQNEPIAILSGHSDIYSEEQYRIVFISSDEGHPFWDELREGAWDAVNEQEVTLQMWGAFRSNPDEILRQMDIGIAANMDGMIVEGMMDPAFARTVHKASAKGIPVITVVNDAPESLRRTYVGSDHYEAGKQIAERISREIKAGKVGLISGGMDTQAIQLQLEGIISYLESHDQIEVVQTDPSQQVVGDVRTETRLLLNDYPDCRIFIGFRPGSAAEIVDEVRYRSRPELFSIYAFDDLPETMQLLEQGIVKATVQQNPRLIGKRSVELMLQWLDNKPLERHDYIPFQVLELSGR